MLTVPGGVKIRWGSPICVSVCVCVCVVQYVEVVPLQSTAKAGVLGNRATSVEHTRDSLYNMSTDDCRMIA